MPSHRKIMEVTPGSARASNPPRISASHYFDQFVLAPIGADVQRDQAQCDLRMALRIFDDRQTWTQIRGAV
jgi:hypothetical protein